MTGLFFKKKNTYEAKNIGNNILHWFEISLAAVILLAVITALIMQLGVFANSDWTSIDTFTNAVKILLELAIGIEVARLLFSYNLNTIIELAAFIVARKMFLINGDFWENDLFLHTHAVVTTSVE